MRHLRPLLIFGLVITALCGSAASAADVTVEASPDHIPAEAARAAQINVDIDITSAEPDDRVLRFEVKASQGTVTPSSFEMTRTENGGRTAHGRQTLAYRAPDNPSPGEVEITVEGAPKITASGVEGESGPGVSLLTETTAFRGLGHLELTRTATSGAPNAPPTASPFKPNKVGVNVPRRLLQYAAGVAALLALLGGTFWRRTHVRRAAPVIVRPQPRPAPVPAPTPYTPPVIKPDRPKRLQADPMVTVALTADPNMINGDGKSPINLRVDLIDAPSADLAALGAGLDTQITQVAITADRAGYGVDPSQIAIGAKSATAVRPTRWERTHQSICFTATVTVSMSMTGAVFLNGASSAVVVKQASCNLTIIGAEPEFRVEVDSPSVLATGRHGVIVSAKLWLFGELAPSTEFIEIHEVRTQIGGRDWRPSSLDPVNPGFGNAAMVRWKPPFLVQDQWASGAVYGDEIELEVDCRWTRGDLWGQAQPISPPIPPAHCPVTLLGCAFAGRTSPRDFAPARGVPLIANVKLVDSESDGVNDPVGAGAEHSPNARISCAVHDLSQGQPSYLPPGRTDANGSKIPPKPPFDTRPFGAFKRYDEQSDAMLDAVLQQIWSAPADGMPVVQVSDKGALFTRTVVQDGLRPILRDDSGLRVMDYTLKAGCDPIDGGLVVYRVLVEDGFDGQIEWRGVFRARLGILVLETGGADFSIYEYRPFAFRLKFEPASVGDAGADPFSARVWPQGDVRLRWEFAVVDADASPLEPAGFIDQAVPAPSEADPYVNLFLGEFPSRFSYETKFAATDQSFHYLPAGRESQLSAAVWERCYGPIAHRSDLYDACETRGGLELRRKWHALPEGLRRPEVGVPWATVAKPEKPPIDPASPVPAERQTGWWDATLPMAVRVEMRDRNGWLLATSDRLISQDVRTPPEQAWRDHPFRYVLLALRLRLQDQLGNPYPSARYALEVDGLAQPLQDKSKANGWIEQLLPPGARKGRLTILHGPPGAQPTVGCTFNLRFGFIGRLESEDDYELTAGVLHRLNNLGFATSRLVGGTADAQDRRAIKRFQSASHLPASGWTDGQTRKALEDYDAAETD